MRCRRLFAVALVCGTIQPDLAAETASPTAAADTLRADLIDRVSRSIIHVKGVRAAEPAFNPFTGMPERDRAKMLKRDPSLLSRMERDQQEPARQEGSAFIFDAERGLALTASHIVAGSVKLTAILPDGRERPLELVGLDDDTGIAVLRVKDAGLPALPFATRRPRTGDTALVVGKMIPFGTILASQGMVMGDTFIGEASNSQLPPLATFFALDNLLPNGGMGGGPSVNMKGEVTGLVSAIYGARGFGQDAVTMAMRVPELRPIIDQLVKEGSVKRSFIGISTQCDEGGCPIIQVERGSPAEVAGLKVADRIITVNGKVPGSDSGLRRIVALAPIGSELALSVSSGGPAKAVVVTTIGRPTTPPSDRKLITDSGAAVPK
jgi:S1-C subfamily serine protease